MSRRPAQCGVVVTGMACVCAAGNSPRAVLHAICEGKRSLMSARTVDARALPYPVFALDSAFFPEGRRHSAHDTLGPARHVVREALLQAALPVSGLTRAAIVMGTTSGSALHFLGAYAAGREYRPEHAEFVVPPCACLHERDEYFTGNLALELEPCSTGPRLTVTNACTSGADAVGLAFDLVAAGICPCAVCGGSDALSLVSHTGFVRLKIHSDEPCRPFDRSRRGLNLGEGAAALVLENEEHARARKATVLGRVLGYGGAADAHHFTAPHPEGRGLESAIRRALAQAGAKASDLAFVNAHGTATPENDLVEGRLLHRLLPGIPIWASKGATGHTLGAAGALEAVLTLTALREGFVPPSPGFEEPDPDIGIVPTREKTPISLPVALSTSLGFGGGNAALILGREEA